MSSPFGRPLAAALLGVAASIAAGANAEPAPPYAVLVHESAQSPRIAEADADVRAAQGRAAQAGTRPNPTLELQVENLAGGRSAQLIAPVQSTLSASQTLELGGKRQARVAAGRASVEAARAQQRQAVAEFGYQLALAYVAAESAQARVKFLEQDLERVGEDLRAAKALVEAGREAELRSVQTQAAVSAVRADLEAARASAIEALGKLSALVGAPSPYTAVGPSLLARAADLALPAGEPPATTPAVLAAEAERDAAAQRVNVERARSTPDVTFSLGARRVEGLGSTLVVGGASVPLPLFDRNRGAVSAARAEQDAAEARLRTARLDAEAVWRSGQARAAASRAALSAAMEGETAAGEAYRLSRIGYEAGRTPLIELLAARRALTEAQTRGLDARAQRIQSEAALARLSGRIPFGETP